MGNTVRALVVREDDDDGPCKVMDVDPDLDQVKERLLGGGWPEKIRGVGWHMYADEDGKLKGLRVNVAATLLARMLGWPAGVLVGPVVFLGSGRSGHQEADVPDKVLDMARGLGVLLDDED
jgi:hypothetical protein